MNQLTHVGKEVEKITTWSRNKTSATLIKPIITMSYSRDDALGLPDAPHLRCVQNEGGLALHLLTETVRVQHLMEGGVRMVENRRQAVSV